MMPFDEMDRLFDNMRRSMMGGRGWMDYAFGDGNLRMEETDDGFVVHADMPGFEREDIDLTFGDGYLSIRAVRELSGDGYTRNRRMHEKVRIPGDVILEDIEASYHNGVLEVRLPLEDDIDGESGHRIDID